MAGFIETLQDWRPASILMRVGHSPPGHYQREKLMLHGARSDVNFRCALSKLPVVSGF